MTSTVFDPRRLAARRERAARSGGDLFLANRAIGDIVDRLSAHPPADSMLLVGCLDPRWRHHIAAHAQRLDIAESAPTLAAAIGTPRSTIETLAMAPDSLDAIIVTDGLGTAADPAAVAFGLRHLLHLGGMLTGVVVGSASLPALRSALLAADRAQGLAAQRVHPAPDPASLAALLQSAGFAEPVIEVDRVDVTYSSLDALVADLRAMGCTSALASRAPPLARTALAAARAAFLADGERATERFELIHFTAFRR